MSRRILLPLSALLFAAACGRQQPAAPAPAAAPPIAVRLAPSTVESWPERHASAGTVRARVTTVLAARLPGYVTAVLVQAGDAVRPGQTLVTLESQDLEAAVRRATAAGDEVRSAFAEADGALAAAEAQAELAAATRSRMQELFDKRSVSRQELDEAAARHKAATAAVDSARARRRQLDARLAQSAQELRAAEIQRSYTRITAPYAGLIAARTVEPGAFAAPGLPLLTLEQAGAYRLEAAVEETRLSAIRPGQSVAVEIDTLSQPLTARVAEILPAIDPGSRTATVKLDLPAAPGLRSGTFGRALFDEPARTALTLPAAALLDRGQLHTVFVAVDGRARARLVTIGATAAGRVEILSGLQPNEPVISPVPANLTDGAPIEVHP